VQEPVVAASAVRAGMITLIAIPTVKLCPVGDPLAEI